MIATTTAIIGGTTDAAIIATTGITGAITVGIIATTGVTTTAIIIIATASTGPDAGANPKL